jgi:hypothetical protein
MTTIDPVETARAKAAGQYAARRRLPATACPYDPAGDARQKVLAASWVRGYLHTRPPSTDYNGDDES